MSKNFSITITLLVSFFCGLFFLTSSEVVAQIPDNITDPIILEQFPETPAPGQQVRVEVESYVSNLSQASISWSLDGEVRQQAIGEQAFTFTAPEAGSSIVVGVSVVFQDGRAFSQQTNITPSGLDLISEGITYTPPLYKGRALFTHESQVNIAAIPTLIEDGRILSPNEIFYRWTINGTYYRDLSGVGKDNVIFTGSVVSRPVTVDVTASNLSGTLRARKRTTFAPQDPLTVLYEKNPLQGILYSKALTGEFVLEREELVISAAPFFFDAEQSSDKSLEYTWGENKKKIDNPLLSSEITFRNENLSRSGVSEIAVITDHLDHLLQDSLTSFTLNVVGSNQLNTESSDVTVF